MDKRDPTVIDLTYDPHTNQFVDPISEAIIKTATPPSLGKEVVTSDGSAEPPKRRRVTAQQVKLGLYCSGKAVRVVAALTVASFIIYSIVRLMMLVITAAIVLGHWFIEAAPVFGAAVICAILGYGAWRLADHVGRPSLDTDRIEIRRPDRRDEDDTQEVRSSSPFEEVVKPVVPKPTKKAQRPVPNNTPTPTKKAQVKTPQPAPKNAPTPTEKAQKPASSAATRQPAWACRLAAQWVAWLRANGDSQSVGMWSGGQYDLLANQYSGDITTAVNMHCNDKCAVSGLLDCHNPNGWDRRSSRKAPGHRDWDLMCATFGKHWLMSVARSNDGGRSFKKIANDVEHDLQRKGFL